MRHWRSFARTVLPCAIGFGTIGCFHKPAYQTAPIPAFMKPDAGLTVQPPDSPVYQAGYNSRAAQQSSVISLPEAIAEVIASNLRLRSGMEKVQMARADLTGASIIPNPTLTADAQFISLPNAVPFKQNPASGPPQWDAGVVFPIDWFIFGKRVAAMQAARLGVDAAAADYADLVRRQVADTLDAFYDVLEAKAILKLAEEAHADAHRFEKVLDDKLKLGGAKAIEADRVKLVVIDSHRELLRRQNGLVVAKSKLRLLLGRNGANNDFDVAGELLDIVPLPVPKLEEALSLAERARPDLLASQRNIYRAEATLRSEEKKAKPNVTIAPMLTYQQIKFATGLPDERFFDIYVTSTLPFTDRNQGGIAQAQSDLRDKHIQYQADLQDVRSQVEQAVGTYRIVHELVEADEPATMKLARDIRDKIEAAYKQGGLQLLEWLDAQREFREHVKASISLRAEYWRSLNHLQSAMGAELPKVNAAP